MHHSTSSRIALFAAVGLLLTPGAGAPAQAGETTAASMSTLSLDQRMHLPDSTRITVGKGTITTLGMLRGFHAARLRSFAQAATLGKNAALTSSRQNPTRLGPSQTVRGTLPGSAMQVTLPIPESPATLQKYAKDYQDFCTAANATACIYLPAGLGYPSGTLISQDNTVVAPDYLITDPTVCAAGGGKISYPGLVDQKVCVYTYPLKVVTQFVPSSSNPHVSHCPSTDWTVLVDHHGAAVTELNAYGPTHIWDPNGTTSLVTCVLQVY
jgi:hypothetical protein